MLNLNPVIEQLTQTSQWYDITSIHSWPNTHNGPYNDDETPLRTLAHLLKINSFLYRKTGEDHYRTRTEKLFEQASASTDAFKNLVFRISSTKDSSNGLIGAAWLIEGLQHAYNVTNMSKFHDASKQVYSCFQFSHKHSTWLFKDNSGTYVTDPTFNRNVLINQDANNLFHLLLRHTIC